jgi:serine/threonine protein phosphatase PrpC
LATAVVHYAAAAATSRGRKRPSNEDAFGFSVEHGVYVVCDGMGGAAAGEVASSLAVDEMMRLLARRGLEGMPPVEAGRLADAAAQAIAAANQAIYSRAQRSQRLCGMGTTLVAFIAEERRAWILNVGDSRGYRMRQGRLEQITMDHSLVEEQVRMGRMSRSEASHSPLRNVITRALGTSIQVTADSFPLEVEPGDLFLLCSDGLTRELSGPRIESLLSAGQPLDGLCAELIHAANKAGGQDNITCMLVRAGE